MSKIFNRNTVKLGSICPRSLSQQQLTATTWVKKINEKTTIIATVGKRPYSLFCERDWCVLDGKCITTHFVDKATVPVAEIISNSKILNSQKRNYRQYSIYISHLSGRN